MPWFMPLTKRQVLGGLCSSDNRFRKGAKERITDNRITIPFIIIIMAVFSLELSNFQPNIFTL